VPDIGPLELLLILALILLLFGGAKLPKLARSLGEAKKEFESGVKGDKTAQADGEKPTS
jgi:sec-independent protein translocase protein TatA